MVELYDDLNYKFCVDNETFDAGLGICVTASKAEVHNKELDVVQLKESNRTVKAKVDGVESKINEFGVHVSMLEQKIKELEETNKKVKVEGEFNDAIPSDMLEQATKDYENHKEKEVEKMVEQHAEKAVEKALKKEKKRNVLIKAETKRISVLQSIKLSFLSGVQGVLGVIAWIVGIILTILVCIITSYLINKSAIPPDGLKGIVEFIRPFFNAFLNLLGNIFDYLINVIGNILKKGGK